MFLKVTMSGCRCYILRVFKVFPIGNHCEVLWGKYLCTEAANFLCKVMKKKKKLGVPYLRNDFTRHRLLGVVKTGKVGRRAKRLLVVQAECSSRLIP